MARCGSRAPVSKNRGTGVGERGEKVPRASVMRQDPFGVVVQGGDGRRWSIDGEVAMAGGGAPAGGEPLILGRPVARARHGGL